MNDGDASPSLDPAPVRRGVSPKRRRLFFSWLIVLFLAGQETTLRLCFPVPEVENFNRIHYSVLLPEPGATPPPLRNARYEFRSDPDRFHFVHDLNLYGFRDRDWPVHRRPGTKRVMLVGDSFTEGAGAPEGGTIVDGFRAAAGEGRWEAMNLGIQGTGLGHQLVLLGDAVPLFRPDHVVLVLMANDFGNMAPPDPRRLMGRMGLPQWNSPLRPRLLYLLEQLAAGRPLATAWKGRPFPFFAPTPDPRNPWSDTVEQARLEACVAPELAEAMRAGRLNPHLPLGHEAQHFWYPKPSPIAAHLAMVLDFLRHHECGLSVVFFPSQGQVSDVYLEFHARYNPPPVASLMGGEYQRPARDTAEACRSLGVPFIDLTPTLREWEAAGRRCYWSYDNHPKAETYLEAGRILFEQLRPVL